MQAVYHRRVHARGVAVDIQVNEDKNNCESVCVCVCVHQIVHRPVFSLHALSQVSFVCLPSFKLQLSSVATQHFAMIINLGPALSLYSVYWPLEIENYKDKVMQSFINCLPPRLRTLGQGTQLYFLRTENWQPLGSSSQEAKNIR